MVVTIMTSILAMMTIMRIATLMMTTMETLQEDMTSEDAPSDVHTLKIIKRITSGMTMAMAEIVGMTLGTLVTTTMDMVKILVLPLSEDLLADKNLDGFLSSLDIAMALPL